MEESWLHLCHFYLPLYMYTRPALLPEATLQPEATLPPEAT
jgi:hypothetical protein